MFWSFSAFKVGAIHSLWFAAIERELHPAPFGPYDIHLSPPAARLPSSPRTLPSGIDRRAVQDSDIETVRRVILCAACDDTPLILASHCCRSYPLPKSLTQFHIYNLASRTRQL